MRLLVMFDLPTETSEDRKAYRHFRKALLNEGFLMIQYSVYMRVCVSKQSAQYIENRIAGYTPAAGLVQTLMVTEQQYNKMHFLVGKSSDDIRNSAERTLIL